MEEQLQNEAFTSMIDILEQVAQWDIGKSELWKYRKYFYALPESKVDASPILCSAMAHLAIISGNIERSEVYVSKLKALKKKYPPSSPRYQAVENYLAFLGVALPHKNQKNILQAIKHLAKAVQSKGAHVPQLSLTVNRPSVVNGGRDWTPLLRHAKFLRRPVDALSRAVLGDAATGAVNVCIAEGLYLQNQISDALVLLVGTMPFIEQKGDVSVLFAAMFLQMEIMVVTEQIPSALPMLVNIENRMQAAGAHYLLPNINAIYAWVALYDNDFKRIQHWMANEAPNENGDFSTLDRFQYFVKLRVYLMQEKHLALLALAERLRPILEAFGRILEQCELNMLLAMSFYAQNMREEAFEYLEKALAAGEKYRYYRLFADEGEKLYFILRDYKSARGDSDFLSYMIELTRKMGLMYPGYLKHQKDSLPPLTETELNVLRLMGAGRTNQEIGKHLEISLNTVKFHTKNIFNKLNVKNRHNAVCYAKEIGLF